MPSEACLFELCAQAVCSLWSTVRAFGWLPGQLGVVQGLKARGKEISNDSVAERMLDL